LAHENNTKSRAMLGEVDQVADVVGLDEMLIDSLLIGLGLE
jgi:hypothetical protein